MTVPGVSHYPSAMSASGGSTRSARRVATMRASMRMSLEEPYLIRHSAYAEIFWDYRDVGLPTGRFRADPDVLADREFANILAGRVVAFQDFVFQARDVLDDLEVVLELISSETAR